MLKLGEKIINQICLGDKKIAKAFLGDKLVYQSDKPIFLEYIEFTGTQYIDTGISHKQGKYGKWVVTSKSTNVSKLKMLLANGGTGIQFFACNSKGKWGFGENIYFDINSDTKITADIVFEDTQVTATIDDESIVRTGTVSTYGNFILGNFALLQNQYGFNGYIYGCSYIDVDGNLVLDLKPCIDPNGIVCMYDMVTKEYYYNTGTGEFIGYKPIDIDYTRIYAFISSVGNWATASDSHSILIPIEVGKKYRLEWETTVGVSSIFRYGQTDIPTPEGQKLNAVTRSSPQDKPIVDITAVNNYLVVQIASGAAEVIANNKYLKAYEIL